MRWCVCVLLFLAVLGLAESGPILLRQARDLNDTTVITFQLVGWILLFLGCLLIWASYLASLLVPWIAQTFVDTLFSVNGARFPASAYRKKKEPTISEKENP